MANVQVGGYTRGGNSSRSKVASKNHASAAAAPPTLKTGVKPGSQQQWFSRNSAVSAWAGGVWNMVFSGVTGAPPSHCGIAKDQGPYTTVEKTPLVAEKPFIAVDGSGKGRYEF